LRHALLVAHRIAGKAILDGVYRLVNVIEGQVAGPTGPFANQVGGDGTRAGAICGLHIELLSAHHWEF
jgi:hypothetical protein